MGIIAKTGTQFSAFLLCSALGVVSAQQAQMLNAGRGQKPFDVTRHAIPIEEIFLGGPDKDGIPALDRPKFLSAHDARGFLKGGDKVLGVVYNGVAKAYPIKILNWHELVNDDFNGRAASITWCPLCLSGVVYDPQVDGRSLTFGVSGRLYKSNVLMYDRETQSLWSQIMQQAVTGPLTGARLKMLPAYHTTWQDWQAKHPDTVVLSPDTGYKRDYALSPYQDYWESGEARFRSPGDRKNSDKNRARIRAMDPVLGVEVNGVHKAYPFSVLKKGPEQFRDRVGGLTLVVHFDKKSQAAYVTDEAGTAVPAITLFRFTWEDFYPQTLLYRGTPE